jgi:hypothetical protein
MGIEEKWTDKALVFGSAIHEAKAVFYETWDEEASVARGEQEIIDRREEFISPDDYEFSLGRIRPLMKDWFITYGHSDQDKYEVIGIEEEIRIPVPFTPGFVHTQRHDAILKDRKTGYIYTFDTKTASSSLDFTLNTVRMSDQVTAYLWGGKEVFGNMHKGFIVDVQYWSSRSSNPKTIKCQRSEPVTRTEHELKVFQTQLASLFNEIQAKEKALKTGVPSPFLYRKNSFYCYSYFRKCAYADICGMADQKIERYIPDNLEVRPTDENRLDSLTYDNIYFMEGPY